MTINEMFNELENKVKDTYIVTLKYKYDFEKDYTIENQILEYDSMADKYVWLDDWYEGQTDVEVLGYRLLSDIDTTKLEPCEDCIDRAEVLMHSHIEYDDDGVGHRVIYAEDIEDLPSVTPQQKVGKWITQHVIGFKNRVMIVCSNCREEFSYDVEPDVSIDYYDYCPNCGSYNGGKEDAKRRDL